MIPALVLIALGAFAAVRLGDSALVYVAIAAVVVQLVLLKRTRTVSSRVGRAVPFGRWGRKAQQLRAIETLAGAVGVALLVWSFFD